MRRVLQTLLPALAAVAATAPAAGAAQYCVGATGTPCDGASLPFSPAGLTGAIGAAKAAGGADEVRIAAGTITGLSPLTIDDAAGVSIVGAGAGATRLQFTVGVGGTALTLTSFRSSLSDVRLTGEPAASTTGILVNAPGSGIFGSFDAGPSATHLHVDGFSTGVRVTRSAYSFLFLIGGGTRRIGGFSLTDSVIDLSDLSAARAVSGRGPSSATTIARTTIWGRGSNQIGLDVTSNAAEFASLSVADSIVEVSGSNAKGLSCVDGAGTAELTTTRTAFSLPATYQNTDPTDVDCGAAPSPLLDPFSSSLGFLNPVGGDFRLAHYSVLIDRGTTAAPGETTDLGGGGRFLDGNGDGAAAIDLGAFEYQRRPPAPPVVEVTSTTVAPGTGLQFTAEASDPDPGDFPLTSWDFGDGTTSASGFANHAYAALGTYTATATATDPTGLTATTQVQIRVENPPGPGVPAPAPTPTPRDPFLTATGPRVRVLTAPAGTVRRSSAGFTTVGGAAADVASLETAGAVTLRVALTRLAPGHRARGRCRTTNTRGPRCTVRTAVPAIAQIPVAPGPVFLRFGGKLGGRRLAKGRYEVAITPVGIDKRKGAPATYPLTLR